MRHALFFLFTLLLFACASQQPETTETRGGSIRGTARVVSVDPQLGQAVLAINGKEVRAFWQTEDVYAQTDRNGGAIIRVDPTGLRRPVGQYKEVVTRPRQFPAKPDDTINFVGLWMGDQIYLTGVGVPK